MKHKLLGLIRRFIYIIIPLEVFLLIFSGFFLWRLYLGKTMKIPLKFGGDNIAFSAIYWWNAPENEGGIAQKPLGDVDFSTFYLNSEIYEFLTDEKTLQFANEKTGLTKRELNIKSSYGFYSIDKILPHYLLLERVRWNTKQNIRVHFETIIDLSNSFDEVSIIPKSSRIIPPFESLRLLFKNSKE